jgi:hypothetical protein
MVAPLCHGADQNVLLPNPSMPFPTRPTTATESRGLAFNHQNGSMDADG